MAEDITVERTFLFQNGHCHVPLPTDTQEKTMLWKFLVLAHLCEYCGERYYWVINTTPMSILCDNTHEHFACKTRTVKVELHLPAPHEEANEEEQHDPSRRNSRNFL